MNPPFTRPTGHEGKKIGVPNPMFAAFSSSAEEQRLMGKAVEKLTKGSSAHGNAGEASIFLVLADRKLKPGGTLALVMPMTLLSGSSWEKSRALLYKDYSDLILVTIAGVDGAEMAFSADTGMGECLVIGRKTKTDNKRAIFVILNVPPAYPLLGAAVAEQIRQLSIKHIVPRLEDAPIGGSVIKFGEDVVGYAIDAPLPAEGTWNLTRIADLSLAQVAYHLAIEKRIWLPTQSDTQTCSIPITVVGKIGEIGPYHLDVSKKNTDGSIRGPFELHTLQSHSVPTYPILWAHDADRERTMVFEADYEGQPYRVAADEQAKVNLKVERVWATASHCHANLDFRFNSQSTMMQFTKRKTIGGRAWLSLQLPTVEHEKALVLWANTTFGLLLFWWHSSKQQAGRGIITKETLHTLPILDVTALSDEQLNAAVNLFDAKCGQSLLPFHEIDKDTVRHELDRQFGRDVLGLDASLLATGGALDILRLKLSKEPSIRGKK